MTEHELGARPGNAAAAKEWDAFAEKKRRQVETKEA
jgi:hypothetical protein